MFNQLSHPGAPVCSVILRTLSANCIIRYYFSICKNIFPTKVLKFFFSNITIRIWCPKGKNGKRKQRKIIIYLVTSRKKIRALILESKLYLLRKLNIFLWIGCLLIKALCNKIAFKKEVWECLSNRLALHSHSKTKRERENHR